MKRLHLHVVVASLPDAVRDEMNESHARLHKAGGNTTGESTDYGSGERDAPMAHEKDTACCVPQPAPTPACDRA